MRPLGPIVITGFMGCGKTAVARQLAARLGCKVVDLDEAITQRELRSPAKIIEDDGEQAFRLIETSVLRTALEDQSVGVIALGGGAWITETNRDLINQHSGFAVWLDAPFAVCWERIIVSGENRPLASSKQQAMELYDRRRPVYQLANARVEQGTDINLDDLACQIELEVAKLKPLDV